MSVFLLRQSGINTISHYISIIIFSCVYVSCVYSTCYYSVGKQHRNMLTQVIQFIIFSMCGCAHTHTHVQHYIHAQSTMHACTLHTHDHTACTYQSTKAHTCMYTRAHITYALQTVHTSECFPGCSNLLQLSQRRQLGCQSYPSEHLRSATQQVYNNDHCNTQVVTFVYAYENIPQHVCVIL